MKSVSSPKVRRDYAWRIGQLNALRRMLVENESEVGKALWNDLRKSQFESVATELGMVLKEIDFAIANLEEWMLPRYVPTPLFNQPGQCQLRFDPLGKVLIIGAWNYPINLLLAPLVGAIAGGNSAVLKPSEIADSCSQLMARLIPRYLDQDSFEVVLGGPRETSQLLDRKFDLIFFTGGGGVAKIIMEKAAKNLTPVVLELGGKSPALVLEDASISVAARRIMWGKFINAGQTCIAPDYVLIHKKIKDKFITESKSVLKEFYGEDPQKSPDYCRIINLKNFDRLQRLIANEHTGDFILHGGQFDREQRYIAPTLLECDLNSPAMREEIFGPILPIIAVDDLESMVQIVNDRPKPLSLYLFSKKKANQDYVLNATSSGGVCINDTVMHMPVSAMPFGGVGASGMGRYHGYSSFQTFTHAKSVLKKTTWGEIPLRYPPYSINKLSWLRRFF